MHFIPRVEQHSGRFCARSDFATRTGILEQIMHDCNGRLRLVDTMVGEARTRHAQCTQDLCAARPGV